MKAATRTQKKHTVAVIQARMGSTRLPGKVLETISDKPMLWHVVERVRRSKLVDSVIVATSNQKSDTAIADFCKKHTIECYRGSESDVLDRYYQAAKQSGADTVVRITADCPLIDPAVIDKVVSTFDKADCDYASNISRYTFPEGLDTEVFSFASLERAWKESSSGTDREHVTPYLRTSGKFSVVNVENTEDLSKHDYHWSVDKPEDLEFVREVFEGMAKKPEFGMADVLALLKQKPKLRLIRTNQPVNEGYYKSLMADASTTAPARRDLSESKRWFLRSKKVIPSAAQTFSKSSQQFVQGVSPIFLQRGNGCKVWDVDGNQYIDFIQGLLPNILGYAHPEVNAAAAHQLTEGHSFSLPHPIEVQLAEKLTEIIPCAEMVRFGKNGSDVTAAAIRAARAFTRRDRVIVCGYHGWQDWYIGSTTRNQGVPGAVQALTHSVPYNDLTAVETLLKQHPSEFAAMILEPVSFVAPKESYLTDLKALLQKHGSLLVFDEICTGFHFGLGGAQKKFGVTPDLAAFGKAMGNGFPIACVVGSAKIMAIFDQIFFSSTFGGEAASMAAAMKVINILETTDALSRIEATGRRLQTGFNCLAKEVGLQDRYECVGYPNWALLKFRDATGKDSLLERSLFQQEAIKRGILLLATHNICAAHTEETVEFTLRAYASVFKTLQGWLGDKNPERFLDGPMIQPVFKVRG